MEGEKKLTIETLGKYISNIPAAIHKAFWRSEHYAKGKKITKSEYTEKLNEFLGDDK